MTQDQIVELLTLLEKIATRPYTITGAADWQILVVISGVLACVIGLMWTDLKATIKENKSDWKEELRTHKEEGDKNINNLWDAMRKCQSDCCPPRNRQGDMQ